MKRTQLDRPGTRDAARPSTWVWLRRVRAACPLPGVLGVLGVLGLLAGAALPQQRGEALVAARFSSGVVKLGGEVALQIVVEGADRVEVSSLPRVEGLAIDRLQGPQRFAQSTFINGRSSSLVQYVWQASVRPLRAGEFEVPPIDLVVDGRPRRTQPLQLTAVTDMRGEELGFFSLHASAERLYEGEPLVLDFEFGWDRGIDSAVDYANLMLPWWGALPGWVELEDPAGQLNRQLIQIGLNRERGKVVGAENRSDVQIGGRTFRRLGFQRILMPTRPGRVEFPKSFLEFRRVTKRAQSFFDNDKTESYYVAAKDLTVEVLPLPEDGRPLDFTGAVGRVDAYADVDVRDVDAGDSIKLTVEWSGHGNFEFFRAPVLEHDEKFAEFRVYGATETKSADRRTVVYDIAPLGPEAHEVPPVRLPYFDTETERYSVVSTDPIPIRVRALAGSGLAPLDGEGAYVEDVRDIVVDAEGPGRRPRPGGRILALALLALPLGWLSLRAIVRRHGDPDSPRARARRRALRALEKSAREARSATDQLTALDAFLAARTATPPAIWSGRDAAHVLAERELEVVVGARDADALAALSELRRRLESAAWGGNDEPAPARELAAVGARLIGGGL